MEGESLFNDATSIVLFEIFFEMVKKLGDGGQGAEGGLLQEGLNIIVQITWLAAGMCSALTTATWAFHLGVYIRILNRAPQVGISTENIIGSLKERLNQERELGVSIHKPRLRALLGALIASSKWEPQLRGSVGSLVKSLHSL